MRTKLLFISLAVLSFLPECRAISDAMKVKIANSQYSDEIAVRFMTGATDTFDSCCDAYKLFSSNTLVPNIFTKTSNGIALSINALPPFVKQYYADVYLRINIPGTYTFSSEEAGAFVQGACIRMRDNVTGQFYDLRSNTGFSIDLPVINITDPPRFTISFSLPANVDPQNATCSGCTDGQATISKAGSTGWQYILQDSIGNIVAAGTAGADTLSLTGLSANKYTLNINAPLSCTETVLFLINEPLALNTLCANVFNNAELFSDGSDFILRVTAGDIKNEKTKDILVQVYSLTGSLLYEKEFMNVKSTIKKLGITDLPAGIYITVAKSKDCITTKKLSKN